MKTKIKKLNLGGWILLDEIRQKIKQFASQKNWAAVAPLMYQFIETAVETPIDFTRKSWYDVADLYKSVENENAPTLDLPIFESKEKGKQPAWEYEGRGRYFWLHTFASKYGWTVEYILGMDVDDAVALWQETLVEEQLQQEWEWGLTEIAYPYNPSTKKSVFKPLKRPDWMLPTVESIENNKKPDVILKIRRDMIPVGNIVSLDGDKQDAGTNP